MGDLGADVWEYSPKTQCVVGLRSGYSVRLVQAIKVRIVSVNVPARQLNVSPAEAIVNIDERGKIKQTSKKLRKGQTSRQSKRKK